MATVLEVKRAIRDILDDSLNPMGVAESERVNLFYGWKEADSNRPHIVVGEVGTDYEAVRMNASSTLRRWDITHTVHIHIVPGLRFRTQETAEEAAYGLLDRVLTPLVRGDDVGRSLLETRLAGVQDVRPDGDMMTIPPDDNRDPQYLVLTFRLAVVTIRN